MDTGEIKPFNSFTTILKILTCLGYYKLTNKPRYNILVYLHHLYRVLIFILSVAYNLQHWIYIVFIVKDTDQSFASLIVEIPQMNLVAKALAIIVGIKKLEQVHDIMNDPIFAANSKTDEEFLTQNRNEFRRLLNMVLIGVTINFTAWTTSPILDRMRNENATVPTFIPFHTNTTLRFALAMLIEHGPAVFVGYGHVVLDILIACYYSQAVVQLKIIKYNLMHIFDSDEDIIINLRSQNKIYIDEKDDKAQEKFVFFVRRYEKVVWYITEVNAVFNKAISFQFYTTSSVVCLVIYKLSVTSAASVSFMFLVASFFILQCQVFLYCYYGELVKYESTYVSDSMYLGEWLSLSPRFRRQLLIAMTRWITPIIPRVSSIVPLSLSTFVSVIQAAFNLFTVLKTTNSVSLT